MHRTGPDRALRSLWNGRRFPCKISGRVRLEFRFAGSRAEIVSVTFVRQAMFRRLRVDLHAADGVLHKMLITRMVMRMRMVLVLLSVHFLTRRLT